MTTIVNWTPEAIATIFWYDAADLSTITSTNNQVTQMLDKSSNGWTIQPLTPGKVGPNSGVRVLNNLNVLEWSKTSFSTNQILENNTFTQSQPFCITGVLGFDDEGLADQDFLFSGTETSNPRISVRRTANTDQFQILTQSGTLETPNGTATENNDYITSFYFNSASSTIRVNGAQQTSGAIPNNSFTSLNIGGNFLADQSLDGYIAEMIAFSNPSDQEVIEGYLAWKWGLQNKLPLNHLYKNNRPVIISFFDGPIPGRSWKEHRRLRLLGYI